MFFGKKLKELRLKKKIGISFFAEKIEKSPSYLTDVEMGYVKPFEDFDFIIEISKILELDKNDELDLIHYWLKPFLMQKKSVDVIPILTSDKNGNLFNEEKREEFRQFLRKRAIEHNEKAEEYNEIVEKGAKISKDEIKICESFDRKIEKLGKDKNILQISIILYDMCKKVLSAAKSKNKNEIKKRVNNFLKEMFYILEKGYKWNNIDLKKLDDKMKTFLGKIFYE